MIIKKIYYENVDSKGRRNYGLFLGKGPLFVKQLLDFYDEPRHISILCLPL